MGKKDSSSWHSNTPGKKLLTCINGSPHGINTHPRPPGASEPSWCIYAGESALWYSNVIKVIWQAAGLIFLLSCGNELPIFHFGRYLYTSEFWCFCRSASDNASQCRWVPPGLQPCHQRDVYRYWLPPLGRQPAELMWWIFLGNNFSVPFPSLSLL